MLNKIIKAELIFDKNNHANISFYNEMELSGQEFEEDYKLAEIAFFNLFCSRLFFIYSKTDSSIKMKIIAKLLMCGLSEKQSILTNNDVKRSASILITMDITPIGLKKFKIRGRGFNWLNNEIDEYNIESIGILYDFLVSKRDKDDFFRFCLSTSSSLLTDYFFENKINDYAKISINTAHDSIEKCKRTYYQSNNK